MPSRKQLLILFLLNVPFYIRDTGMFYCTTVSLEKHSFASEKKDRVIYQQITYKLHLFILMREWAG